MSEPAPPSASQVQPETRIDHFRVRELLGKGGMGAVYLAEDENLGRVVALKVLSPALLQVEGYKERFHREARSAARLQHPNIIGIFHFGEYRGLPYYAMEYVEGTPLDALLERRGPLPPEEVVGMGLQVVAGLAHAKEHGVIHRDLKPANLIQGRAGRVRVLDFGLARMAQSTSLTSSGMVMGTPDYMAPEQGLGKKVDHRADIYAFGVTLYHLLSGRLPFRGDSALEVMMAHVQEPPPPLEGLRSGLPAGLVACVGRCIEKAAEARFQEYEELEEALRGALDGGAPALPKPSGASAMAPAGLPPEAGPGAPAGRPVSASAPTLVSDSMPVASLSSPGAAPFPPEGHWVLPQLPFALRHPVLALQGVARRPDVRPRHLLATMAQLAATSWLVTLLSGGGSRFWAGMVLLTLHMVPFGAALLAIARFRRHPLSLPRAFLLALWCTPLLTLTAVITKLPVFFVLVALLYLAFVHATAAWVVFTGVGLDEGEAAAAAAEARREEAAAQLPKSPPPAASSETVVSEGTQDSRG